MLAQLSIRLSLADFLRDADSFYEQWSNCPTSELENANAKRSRAMSRLQQSLIAARELNDEKMELSQALQVRLLNATNEFLRERF